MVVTGNPRHSKQGPGIVASLGQLQGSLSIHHGVHGIITRALVWKSFRNRTEVLDKPTESGWIE